jgi:hypothetical protein
MAEDSAMKRIGIMLLQLLVTEQASGMYFTIHKSEHRSRMHCERPTEIG